MAITGYYSVMQYCPNGSRMEVANIGVVLLVDGCLFMRMSANNDRIRRFFGDDLDFVGIDMAKKMVEGRLKIEDLHFLTREKLDSILWGFRNEIIFTELRSIRVEDVVEIERLYKELVVSS